MKKPLDFVSVTVRDGNVHVNAMRKNHKGRSYGRISSVEFLATDKAFMLTAVEAVKSTLALKFDQ